MKIKPIKLISENEINTFLKAGTVEDVELYFNSLITMRKHLDIDKKIKDRKYGVKLIDKKPSTGKVYKVGSNSIGKEALRVLTKKHSIENGGSESDNSLYFVFYVSKD